MQYSRILSRLSKPVASAKTIPFCRKASLKPKYRRQCAGFPSLPARPDSWTMTSGVTVTWHTSQWGARSKKCSFRKLVKANCVSIAWYNFHRAENIQLRNYEKEKVPLQVLCNLRLILIHSSNGTAPESSFRYFCSKNDGRRNEHRVCWFPCRTPPSHKPPEHENFKK